MAYFVWTTVVKDRGWCLVRFVDVVLIGGIEANDNYQKPMVLDDQPGLGLAGHVDLNVRVGGLRVITAKSYVFIVINKISRFRFYNRVGCTLY